MANPWEHHFSLFGCKAQRSFYCKKFFSLILFSKTFSAASLWVRLARQCLEFICMYHTVHNICDFLQRKNAHVNILMEKILTGRSSLVLNFMKMYWTQQKSSDDWQVQIIIMSPELSNYPCLKTCLYLMFSPLYLG